MITTIASLMIADATIPHATVVAATPHETAMAVIRIS